jgi:hypothetical protein
MTNLIEKNTVRNQFIKSIENQQPEQQETDLTEHVGLNSKKKTANNWMQPKRDQT